MRNSLVFIILLIASVIIELSIINTFSYPFFLFPLTFAIGVLMLHMLPVSLGAIWFTLLPLMLSALGSESVNIIPYLVTALVGIALTMRVFTRRSSYALIGLGIILLSTFTLSSTILSIDIFSHHPTFKSFIFLAMELVVALIAGFILIQKFRPIGSLFILPRKT